MTAPTGGAGRPLRRVCVFCGSSTGSRPAYVDAARALGRALAAEGVGLVYGGGAVGLMGVLADAALEAAGEVVGVIPKGLFSREVGHPGLTALHEVRSMHERKALMYDLSDGFVALPGGLGTLEELAEVATWSQLGLHAKPLLLVDLDGFYDGLLSWLDRAVDDGLLRPANRRLVLRCATVDDVLPTLRSADVPAAEKWIAPGER